MTQVCVRACWFLLSFVTSPVSPTQGVVSVFDAGRACASANGIVECCVGLACGCVLWCLS